MRRSLGSGSLAIALLCAVPAARGAVYKCTPPGGKTAYQAAPCADASGVPLGIVDVAPRRPAYPASAPRPGNSDPEVAMPEAQQRRARAALALLRARDPEAHAVVAGYIGKVEAGPRTAMRANAEPPTMFLSAATASRSVTWLAAVFAHESYHSKLYHDHLAANPGRRVPRQAWGGTAAEMQCERHALGVLKRVGAPQSEIDWAVAHSDGSHVNDWDFEGETSLPRR